MDGEDDIDEWGEALRLYEAAGDPAALESVIVGRVPLLHQELVRRAIRKGLRPVSDRTKVLADAYVYFVEHETDVEYRVLFEETRAQFRIHDPSILEKVLAKNRNDVNDELRRRGCLKEPRGKTTKFS